MKLLFGRKELNTMLALFERAPLAPITMNDMKKSLFSDFMPTRFYEKTLQQIQRDVVQDGTYWGIDQDLKQAEETSERAAEWVLDLPEEPEMPFVSVLTPIPQQIMTPHGKVSALQINGATYFVGEQTPSVLATTRGTVVAVERNGAIFYHQQ